MKRSTILTLAAVLAACSHPPAETPAAKQPAGQGTEPLKATVWTQGGELYLEYPPLVRGRKERFAIHLTRLNDFRAVKDAACEVRLGTEIFPCDRSTHPGIFGANVEPKATGDSELSVLVHGKDLNETFRVGPVSIAPDESSVRKPEEVKEETIAFSKEQQWALDFGTELAAERVLSDAIRVAAETMPRTGGEAKVMAPAGGRLSIELPLTVGTNIAAGTEFASVVPPASPTTDLTSLQLSETEAKVALEQAQRDRARAERLLAAGAVPARRAEEARMVEATALARLQAAQSRLAQFEATRSAEGRDSGIRRFVIRAPIAGVLADVNAVNGSNVEAGQELIHIVDTSSIYVSGVVPESEIPRLRELSGAEIEMPDGQVRPAGRLIAVGRLVDPETRTVPVTYEVDNRDRRLAINQTLFLRLFLKPMGKSPSVPETAVIDDAGRPVVFVQRGGETFLRKPVQLGIRNHGMVQVLNGVNAGDRVVTKGAYLIRLSTMSSAVPAHGHVH